MPGVPPNAIAGLKDALKNLLRPGRKRNQQQQQAQSAQQQDEQTTTASQPDVPSRLPSTHPLATGQHSEPQTALPKPEGSAASAVLTGSEGATKEQVNKQSEDKAPVSPVTPAPVSKDEASKPEPVSAVPTEHDKPLSLPKTDGANDAKAAEVPLTSQPTTHEPLPATNENAKPSVVAPATATAPAATAPAPTTETQHAAKTSSESARDEKMPVMAEEPPEIKAKAAAPGMSATSGPLDDFPIEDDKP